MADWETTTDLLRLEALLLTGFEIVNTFVPAFMKLV